MNNPEKNISAELRLDSRYVTIYDSKLHYVEDGDGDPVLFLHGIPANLYLWRNVIPEISGHTRAIALDLAGFGKSEVPKSGGYDAFNQYKYLKGFIAELALKNITIVATDLGSLLGMKYAADHPENIKGLVIFEGMVMPALDYYNQLSLMQKIMYMMFRNKMLAKSILVNGSLIRNSIMQMMTLRKLSNFEINVYNHPYAIDIEKRRLVLEGPGPVNFPQKAKLKPESATNESVVIMNDNARKLKGSTIPILILYADPGVILNKPARDYVNRNFVNSEFICLGKGKHFLPEEHPKAMGVAIRNWLVKLK